MLFVVFHIFRFVLVMEKKLQEIIHDNILFRKILISMQKKTFQENTLFLFFLPFFNKSEFFVNTLCLSMQGSENAEYFQNIDSVMGSGGSKNLSAEEHNTVSMLKCYILNILLSFLLLFSLFLMIF